MSKKKPVKKHTNRKISNTTIQIIAAVVVVVAIVAIVVANIIIQQRKGVTETPVSAPVRKTYQSEPAMQIDTAKKYTATIKMAKGGEFVIQLLPDKAPRTVNSFVFLAREKYFDGVTFHRVIDNFMAQGGDPTGKGSGGPGYKFVNER